MLRSNCPRKWFFRYVKKYKKQGSFSWALLFGDAIHQMFDHYYTYMKDDGECLYEDIAVPEFRFEEDIILRPDQKDEHEYYQGLARIMFDAHSRYYFELDQKMVIESCEEEAEFEHMGMRLRGKIDLRIHPTKKDGLFILDHKTIADFNPSWMAGWQFKFQFLFYAWMYWKITDEYPAGIYVNAIRKPKERRSVAKAESVKDFLRRIKHNITIEPEKYFLRQRIPIDKGTLPRFEENTLNPVLLQFNMIEQGAFEVIEQLDTVKMADPEDHQEYLRIAESLMLSANTDHCNVYNRPCEYLELCSNNFQDHADEYIQMGTKHVELSK